MATKRRKKRVAGTRRPRRGLFGTAITAPTRTEKIGKAAGEGALLFIAALAGGITGAALGNFSLIIGLPATMGGAFSGNKYLISAGLGMCLANGFQSKTATASVSGMDEEVNGADEMYGFTPDEVKNRVANYFKNFSEKLFIKPAAPQTVGSLNNVEQPGYFINPYQATNGFAGNLDMTDLDRIEAQVARMSGVSGDADEREY